MTHSPDLVVGLCDGWIRRFGRNTIGYAVRYHADQDLDELRQFWVNGVLTISTGDTALSARLGGWMDRLREEWV